MSNPITRLKARAIAPAKEPPATAEAPSADSSGSSPAPPWPSTWPDPAPCAACLSPAFWIDVYGGGPRCCGCSAPSSPALVAYVVWSIDGDDGSTTNRRWVRDPHAEGDHQHSVAEDTHDDWFTWQLPGGGTATALRERVHTRVAGPSGRYSPALVCGPVGDLTLDEWFERLPELQPFVAATPPGARVVRLELTREDGRNAQR